LLRTGLFRDCDQNLSQAKYPGGNLLLCSGGRRASLGLGRSDRLALIAQECVDLSFADVNGGIHLALTQQIETDFATQVVQIPFPTDTRFLDLLAQFFHRYAIALSNRSEERRVGKECRGRRSPYRRRGRPGSCRRGVRRGWRCVGRG